MLTLDNNHSLFQIRAYQPGLIQINENNYTHSVLLSATTLMEDWPPQQFTQLRPEHLAVVLELKPVILLIGSGEKLQFPPVELYGELINHGIGVEVMTTSAASRTFNVLTAEERNVVAALLIR